MWHKRLLWQLFPCFLFVSFLALIAVTWYATASTGDFYREQTAKDLEARARLVEVALRDDLLTAIKAYREAKEKEKEKPLDAPADVWDFVSGSGELKDAVEAVDEVCKDRGKRSRTRITVILFDGTVIGESQSDPADLENHADRPEIRAALDGTIGQSIRSSPSLKKPMMYVGVPVTENDGTPVAVIRTAMDLAYIGYELGSIYGRIIVGGLIVAGIAAILSLIISRRIARPLEELKAGAERFAQGDLSVRLPLSDTEELGGVAESLNRMAQQLDDQFRTITEQRNEVEAILSSMVEGVLAVDTSERIISMNQAAARLLGVDPAEVEDRVIQEVVRHPALQEVVAKALAAEAIVEREIILHGHEDRYLQAHGSALCDSQGNRMGALVVLYDITRIRRLENLRREFVANVSHELRTPITSIKGFVETLQDGAMEAPEDRNRFLGIIGKQADRLNAIMEDLPLLAGLEQGRDKAVIMEDEGELGEVLQSAIQSCSPNATKRSINLALDCDPNIKTRMNSALLEQAIVNLIDNAIKYSNPETQVDVLGHRDGGEIIISVRDSGCGIDSKDQPRIFERFYRVDKARSRKLGGTGLGLAIVKHIAHVHGGWVGVESKLGEGSTFSIHIPAHAPES